MAFTDVAPTTPFAAEIQWCADQGILRGWSDGSFRPLTTIRRDAMAAALHRLAGTPDIPAPVTAPYPDVPVAAQFSREIAWAQDTGLLRGWRDGTFRPLAPIARDATCALLHRAAGEPAFTPPSSSPFRDVRPGQQFYTAMCWAQSAGIVTGWPDGTFRPLNPTNRDAMAAMLRRFDLAVG